MRYIIRDYYHVSIPLRQRNGSHLASNLIDVTQREMIATPVLDSCSYRKHNMRQASPKLGRNDLFCWVTLITQRSSLPSPLVSFILLSMVQCLRQTNRHLSLIKTKMKQIEEKLKQIENWWVLISCCRWIYPLRQKPRGCRVNLYLRLHPSPPVCCAPGSGFVLLPLVQITSSSPLFISRGTRVDARKSFPSMKYGSWSVSVESCSPSGTRPHPPGYSFRWSNISLHWDGFDWGYVVFAGVPQGELGGVFGPPLWGGYGLDGLIRAFWWLHWLQSPGLQGEILKGEEKESLVAPEERGKTRGRK